MLDSFLPMAKCSLWLAGEVVNHAEGGERFDEQPAGAEPTSEADRLFTKPPVGSYPSYLNQPQFCASAIAANASCATIPYKSGTRAYIESQGYDIVANFGDQFSDLLGGFSDKTFKMPNPNYYLP